MDSTSLQNSLRSGADAALDELLARARTLEEDRLAPRRPLGPCLRALGQVLTLAIGLNSAIRSTFGGVEWKGRSYTLAGPPTTGS